jgi:hypothetical protein
MGKLLMATSATRLHLEWTVGAQVAWETGISSRPNAGGHTVSPGRTQEVKSHLAVRFGIVTREGSAVRRQLIGTG